MRSRRVAAAVVERGNFVTHRFKYLGRFFLLCAGCIAALSSGAWADSLHYQFADNTTPIYQVLIQADLPDGTYKQSGQIYYKIGSVDPSNGQIRLKYATAFKVDQSQNTDGSAPTDAGPATYTQGPSSDSSDIMVDAHGTLMQMDQSADAQLRFLLGAEWHLLLPALPAQDQQTWTTDRDLVIYEYNQQQQENNGPFGFPQGPPSPFWHQPQEPQNRVDRQSHETVNYSIASSSGSSVTVSVQADTATREKVGDTPLIHQTGTGQFVFDKQAGLVTSLSMKFDNEENERNVSVKIPVVVFARLITGDELAKFLAARQVQIDADAKAARLDQIEHADDCNDLPEGTSKTRMVGGQGGGPYIICRAGKQNVIGFKFVYGDWGGHECIHIVRPLYEAPTDREPPDVMLELAKPGYVVGGCNMRGLDTGLDGIQVIFMRRTDKGLDPTDTYLSKWYGVGETDPTYKLAGNGERVIGQFGRQGLNADAVGLVVDGVDTSDTPDAAPVAASSGDAGTVNPNDVGGDNSAPEDENVNEIPPDTRRTTMVGDQGGGPFIKCRPSKKTVVGFRFSKGSWGGRTCVSDIEPLWDRRDGNASDPWTAVAREGYVVGGMILNGDDNGMYSYRVIFVGISSAGKINPSDRYLSPWFGDAANDHYIRLAGAGQRVIGCFGRKGMNIDAIGLVLDGAAPSQP
jgi:hypothetical protein